MGTCSLKGLTPTIPFNIPPVQESLSPAIVHTPVIDQVDAAVATSLLHLLVLAILHGTSILSTASSAQDSNRIASSTQDSTGFSSLS